MLATYADGRPLDFDYGAGQFTIGGVGVSASDVRAWDAAGQLAWASAETRAQWLAWIDSTTADPLPVSPVAPQSVSPGVPEPASPVASTPQTPGPKRRRATILLAILAVLVLGLCSCVALLSSGGTPPESAQGQAPEVPIENPEVVPEAPLMTESEAPALPEVNTSGDVHVPAVGSDERDALMDAARAMLAIDKKFVVYSLASDGAWALGILQPQETKDTYAVAFRKETAGGWVAYWTGAPKEAAEGGYATVDDRLPSAVAKRVDFEATAPPEHSTAAFKKTFVMPVSDGEDYPKSMSLDAVWESNGRTIGGEIDFSDTSSGKFTLWAVWEHPDGGTDRRRLGSGRAYVTPSSIVFTFSQDAGASRTEFDRAVAGITGGKKYRYRFEPFPGQDNGELQLYESDSAYDAKQPYLELVLGLWG